MARSPLTGRRERALILTWLGFCALLLVTAVGVGLGGADRLVEAWDARWDARLARGEELFRAGRFEEAATYLERLDREHPAIFVKHRLDRQRERVLELLARSQMALERKGRAFDAAERLARFDPRNWQNHFLRAEVAEHFGDGAAADEAYARVLELHPSHLPSVTGRIALAFGAGHYAEVPPLYEAYLDAWRVAQCSLEAGGARAALELPVDGRSRPVEAVFNGSDPASGAATDPARIALATAGYAIRLERFELVAAPRAGEAGGAGAGELSAVSAWTPLDMRAVAETPGLWIPTGPGAHLLARAESAPGATRARLSIAAFKPLPAELWAMVEKSYQNVLDREGLAAARARSAVGAPEAPLQFVD